MLEHPEHLTQDNMEGVNRVKSSTHYAFLMESTSIEYNTKRECNLKKIGDALDEKCYGIAMRKSIYIPQTYLIRFNQTTYMYIYPLDWPHRNKFNNALLELQEQGVLEKMKNKWWNEVGTGICATKEEAPDATPLDMNNLEGVFFVLTVGSCLALLYGIVSWAFFVIKKAHHYRVRSFEIFSLKPYSFDLFNVLPGASERSS